MSGKGGLGTFARGIAFALALGGATLSCGDDDAGGMASGGTGNAGGTNARGGSGPEGGSAGETGGGSSGGAGNEGGAPTDPKGGSAGGPETGGASGEAGAGGGTDGPLGLPQCAAPLDRSVASTVFAMARCLFQGADAPQRRVKANTIDAERVAVLRGRVLDANGEPLSGVTVSVVQHPEYGDTLSRADGYFDLAVNGGNLVAVRYELSGYLSAQRHLPTEWQNFSVFPDVVLLSLPDQASAVDLTQSDVNVVEGDVVEDASGRRQEVLVFAPDTQASLVLPDGTKEPLDAFHVRVREFTVGELGPLAMPGDLPPSSGYTYAVAYSVDEAIEAGASRVEFDPPVVSYVDNFLGFPAGTQVPNGVYDPDTDAWSASESGFVLDILGSSGGVAEVDTDGDGKPELPSVLADLGITQDELRVLASRYAAGQSLWRTLTPHFSSWDKNWFVFPPIGAGGPDGWADSGKPPPIQTTCHGSIIGCENQTLGEVLPISGTPFSLHYQSERTLGRLDPRELRVKLSGDTLPKPLKRIDLEVTVGGQLIRRSYEPEKNLSDTVLWDGKDAYGRVLQGQQPATARVGYVYDASYQATDTFGYRGNGTPITGDAARSELTFWASYRALLGSFVAEPLGLGGWTLDAQHFYDPTGHTLYYGNGEQRTPQAGTDVITTVAGPGSSTLAARGDGGPASLALVSNPQDVEIAADGSVYFIEGAAVRKIERDGHISTYAGSGTVSPPNSDGGPATDARLGDPTGLGLGKDGTLFIAADARAFAVSTDGIIRTVAGNGDIHSTGDGGLATDAGLMAQDVATGPDGSLYISDHFGRVIRRVMPDGVITTWAGNGTIVTAPTGDGGLATATAIGSPWNIAVNARGEVFFCTYNMQRDAVRKIDANGVITTLVGAGGGIAAEGAPAAATSLLLTSAIALAPDGSLFFSAFARDSGSVWQVRNDGTLHRVAGGGAPPAAGAPADSGLGDGWPPTQAFLGRANAIKGVAIAPNGSIYLADGEHNRLRRVIPAYPGFADNSIAIASEDAREVYIFSKEGRHLSTVDALTKTALSTFEYDDAGRLVSVTDQYGSVTQFSRDADGNIEAITGPYDESTAVSLDARGYLASVTNANDETTSFAYSSLGLLQSLTGPRAPSDVHRFSYDSVGRLLKDTTPSGSFKTLTRSEEANGSYSVVISTRLGRSQAQRVSDPDATSVAREVTGSDGVLRSLKMGSGTITRTTPTSTTTTILAGDPRFSMQAPLKQSEVIQLKGGNNPTQTRSESRSVTLDDPADPFSVATLEETLTVNGLSFVSNWDAATSTRTSTSPAGRTVVETLDDKGALASLRIGAFAPISFTRDAQGKPTSVSFGSRTKRLDYDDQGRLASLRDALAQRTTYTRDAVGRPLTVTLPDDNEIATAFDSDNNLVSVTPPGQPVHALGYAPGSLLTSYAPPALESVESSSTSYTYDEDERLETLTYPSGASLVPTYDATSGRLRSIKVGDETTSFSYDATTGHLLTLTGNGQTLTLGYTGDTLTRTAWSGTVSGNVTQTLDSFFRPSTETVGSTVINLGYDNDGLLTTVGAETLTRDPRNGTLTGTILGTVSDSITYTDQGEPLAYSAVSGETALYAVEISRDALGRIATRKETIGGSSTTDAYTYDSRGRFTKVTRGAVVIGSYAYDANDNRISASDGKGTRSATHDAQDRLLTDGTTSFTYTPEGALLTKTSGIETTNYDYDLLGALRGVTLPNGTQIDYLVDGTRRRIGKKVNGALNKAFLYKNTLPTVSATAPPYHTGTQVVAELDASGALVSRFLYGSKPHVPDAMLRAGKIYRLISDERGSVRLVVDTASGVVAQRIDYDAWGSVMSDSSPGFQPFGFAGGLYDPDTGLVRFGARDYEPGGGRWMQKDPIRFQGGQANLYAYVGSDPVNRRDPSGLGVEEVAKCTYAVAVCRFTCNFKNPYGAGACAACLAGAAFFGCKDVEKPDPPAPQGPERPDTCPAGWHSESVSEWLLAVCVPDCDGKNCPNACEPAPTDDQNQTRWY